MDIKSAVWDCLLANRRITDGFQYTVPSPSTYPYQWLWDSCFHAIILTHFNTEDAKKELLSLVAKQFDDGMLPHMIYWDKHAKNDFPVIEWGKKDTSTITQPPLIAYSAWRIYRTDQDKNFLHEIYPKLKKFYQFLIKYRNPRKSNLLGIINPDESGEDNSPRFDKLLNLPPVHSLDINFQRRLELVEKESKCNFDNFECMSEFFWIKDVPFNVIAVKGFEYLSKIAQELGLFEEAEELSNQADLIKMGMRKLMFEDGIFWSVYGDSYEKIKIKTWAIFIPMFANLYTYGEAREVVKEYLLNKNSFDRKFLLPTVSKDEASYDPSGPWRGIAKMLSTHLSWRGPVWMGANWFICKGLKNYGFFDIAREIYKSSITLVEKEGFREMYDPENGKGMGAKEFTWGGLVLDM